VQVVVLDPTQEIARRAHHMAATHGVGIVAVGSLPGLASPLVAAGSDDVVIARVRSHDEGVRIADYLRHRSFPGTTYFVVDALHQAEFEARLALPRAAAVPCTAAALETLFTRVLAATEAGVSSSASGPTFHGLVGRSKPMLDVFARMEKAARGDANVCIYGESGTGKELIARAVHAMSDRRNGPLVTFDCAAVPETLAESQLFGHVKGAYTGAIDHRDGVFAQADGGTLFIDELCELAMPLQAKLLRVVQGREFVKVGGTKPVRTDIRLVTATNKDPKAAVDAGVFRADLYYRVAVVMIKVPPLRERRDDIPLFVNHFLERYSTAYRKPIRGVQPSAIERMMALPWLGNIRQLENFLAQAVVLAESDMLTERDLFVDDVSEVAPAASSLDSGAVLPLREVERRHIVGTLQRLNGNRTEAAKRLGISVRCLQYKLKAYAGTETVPVPGRPPIAAEPTAPPLMRTQILA
jgi:two-component system, NtrC family, response regulator HydG